MGKVNQVANQGFSEQVLTRPYRFTQKEE